MTAVATGTGGSTEKTAPNLRDQIGLWRSLLLEVRLPKARMALVAVTAIMAAMSEFFSIALIQPVLILFSGQKDGALQLSGFQAWVVDWLEGLSATDRILILVGMLICLQVLREVLLFLSELVSVLIRTAFERQMREKVYDRCLRIPIAEYTNTSSGDIHTTMNSYPRSAAGYVFSLLSAIPQIVMLAVYLALMSLLDWRLLLVVGAVALVIFRGMRIAYAKQAVYGRTMRDMLVETASKANELVQALPVIRAFAQEQRMARRYADVAGRYLDANAASSIVNSAIGPLQRLLSFVTILLSISVFYVITGGGEEQFLSTLVVFLIILARVNGPLTALNLQRAGLAQLYPFVSQLLVFLSTDRDVDRVGGKKAGPFDRIVFDDVRFFYKAGVPVLSGIDLTIESGEFVALVGPSGAGKTTIAALLGGFSQPTQGQITVNGLDMQELDMEAWRRRVAVVPQSPYMFDTSILENIRFGRPEATREDVERVSGLANAEEFIRPLPDGYDTMTGEGGDLLSGGQIQRLALARALITEPDLLILDEATSAQDTESEDKIRQTLDNLRGKVGLLVIAHRLSTIRNADKIVVLNAGSIVESGTHSELMARPGLYADLYRKSLNEEAATAAVALPGGGVSVFGRVES